MMTAFEQYDFHNKQSVDDSNVEKLSSPVETSSSLESQDVLEKNEQSKPDGGLNAWMQVLGSFLLSLNSWGVIYSYGAFQTFYQESFLQDESTSKIAWLGSIQSFLLGTVGLFVGPLYDAGYLSPLIGTGTFFVVAGLIATSFCTEWWQLLLAQAICTGIGTGCLYIPSVAVPVNYFERKQALAMGIAQSGGAVGGIIFPIAFQQMLKNHGFAWATRTLALISLVTCVVAAIVMLPEALRRKREPLWYLVKCFKVVLDVRALQEPAFGLFVFASFTSDLGLFGPTTYIQPYAISVAHFPESLATALLPVLNGASVPGRIIPAALAGRTGPLNLLIPMATTAGALTIIWIAIRDNVPGLFVFAVAYGMMYGAYIVLPEVAIANMTKDHNRLGARIGICGLANAFGSLVGTPVAGALLNAAKSYIGVQLFAGLAMVFTGLLLLIVRILLVGKKIKVKA